MAASNMLLGHFHILDFTYPCLLLAGNSGPGFGAMKTSSSVNLKERLTLHCTQHCTSCSLLST